VARGEEVVVACVALDQPAAVVARLAEPLSADERARAARFRGDELRRRFVVAHGALRLLAAAQLELDPAALCFAGAEGKRPTLVHLPPGRGLSLSLSHSGELALIAMTDVAPVGVDVEQVRSLDDPWRLAETVFTTDEIRMLRAEPPARLMEAWHAGWTRKEATLKTIGTGLGVDPRAIELLPPAFVPTTTSRELARELGEAPWTVMPLRPAPGYVGALAVRRRPARATLLHWPRQPA